MISHGPPAVDGRNGRESPEVGFSHAVSRATAVAVETGTPPSGSAPVLPRRRLLRLGCLHCLHRGLAYLAACTACRRHDRPPLSPGGCLGWRDGTDPERERCGTAGPV